MKFYPCEKGGGGAEKVLAMLKPSLTSSVKGGTKRFEVVLTGELEALAILMGGGRLKV